MFFGAKDFTERKSIELSKGSVFVESDALVGACNVTINFPSWEASWFTKLEINPITPSLCGTKVSLGGLMEGCGAFRSTS